MTLVGQTSSSLSVSFPPQPSGLQLELEQQVGQALVATQVVVVLAVFEIFQTLHYG